MYSEDDLRQMGPFTATDKALSKLFLPFTKISGLFWLGQQRAKEPEHVNLTDLLTLSLQLFLLGKDIWFVHSTLKHRTWEAHVSVD